MVLLVKGASEVVLPQGTIIWVLGHILPLGCGNRGLLSGQTKG